MVADEEFPAAQVASEEVLAGEPAFKMPTSSSKPRVRDVHHDDGEGNWLVSYSDLMTLMFGFFVMIAAFSTPDAAKMEKLKQQTAKAMGVKYQKPFGELTDSVKKLLKDMGLDQDVAVVETGDGIAIQSKGKLFFDSGSTELKPEAEKLMELIANVLVSQAAGFRVAVEGHTDNVPIMGGQFPSNWELSSARAATVVRLLEKKGFEHKNLRPVGFADTEPVLPNNDSKGNPVPENQAENRRIVIRVQKTLPQRMSH